MITNPQPGSNSLSPPDAAAARIAAAMIDLTVEAGYEAATAGAICERAGVHRDEFDSRFPDTEACFLRLYDEIENQLCERVCAAFDGPKTWHDRLWAAGWAAMRFLREDPSRARFAFVEAPGLKRSPATRRRRAIDWVARLIDAGREELEEPSAISVQTAKIAAGAIYDTVQAKVREGWIERGEDFLPELVYIAVLPYLGLTVAEDELLVKTLR